MMATKKPGTFSGVPGFFGSADPFSCESLSFDLDEATSGIGTPCLTAGVREVYKVSEKAKKSSEKP